MITRVAMTRALMTLGTGALVATLAAPSAFASAPYVGWDLGFGQAYSTSGGSPGVAYNLKLEGGYIATLDTWSRVEIGLGFLSGGTTFRTDVNGKSVKSSTSLGPGALAKIGYGYAVADNLMTVWRLGAGMTSGILTSGDSDPESFVSPIGVVGMDLVMQTESSLDIIGGIELGHYAFDVDGPVGLNAPTIRLGMRLRFGGTESIKTTGHLDAP